MFKLQTQEHVSYIIIKILRIGFSQIKYSFSQLIICSPGKAELSLEKV